MQCGAKCFIVQVERDGKVESMPVTARSSVQARKKVRLQYEDVVKVLTVREDKK